MMASYNLRNESEFSSKRFLGENSDKGISGQYLRPNFHPIYQMSQTVEIVSNLRPILFGLKVRTSNEPSGSYPFQGGICQATNGNLSCIFSTEKWPVVMKRGRRVEVMSNLRPTKILGEGSTRRFSTLTFVRTFGLFTMSGGS